ncbi:methyl-accepting chemotaxis protein [Yersinia enterocolitica]|nr:methyl-accepting chemotaxis protein [Yersinia enterocolitica]
MFKRMKVVTSLLLVLVLFGALQLVSGGLFFNSLKNDKENFAVLQVIRQQQSVLNESWVNLLQTRNTLNRAGIRYMMDVNHTGSGPTVNDLLASAKAPWVWRQSGLKAMSKFRWIANKIQNQLKS